MQEVGTESDLVLVGNNREPGPYEINSTRNPQNAQNPQTLAQILEDQGRELGCDCFREDNDWLLTMVGGFDGGRAGPGRNRDEDKTNLKEYMNM